MNEEKCVRRKRRLDGLVRKVSHIELSECSDFAAFRIGVQAMIRNLEESLSVLNCCKFSAPQVRRTAEALKLKAVRLLELCRAVPDSFEDPQNWREMANHIIANYEHFRIEAGHLYRLAVPSSSFGILRSAL